LQDVILHPTHPATNSPTGCNDENGFHDIPVPLGLQLACLSQRLGPESKIFRAIQTEIGAILGIIVAESLPLSETIPR
jgi:hypothetical protein